MTTKKKETKAPEEPKQPEMPMEVEFKPNRAQREKLIQYWRGQGWTYERIVAKFEAGVSKEEYDAAIAAMEA